MNFLALLLGLVLERLLTQLFHLRELNFLNPLFDLHLRRLATEHPGRRWLAWALTGGLILALVVPVALVDRALRGELLQIPSFLFKVMVLLFALGPRDLADQVEDYADALNSQDVPRQLEIAEDLLEAPPPSQLAARNAAVERAIYVQANNRMFGVVFWFLVAGAPGAWTFRALDLLRHRVEVKARDPMVTATMDACRTLHGLLAFVPARLLALGYVLAGNFEEAMVSWRNRGREATLPFAQGTGEILARVGSAAAGRGALDVEDVTGALDQIRRARALVMRTLWMIWCPVIAVLTLYEWLT